MLTHFYCKIILWLFWTIFQTTKCFNLFSSFLHTACSYNCLEPIKLISTIFGCLLHLCWCIYTSCCKVFGWSRTLCCHQALRHIYHWKKRFLLIYLVRNTNLDLAFFWTLFKEHFLLVRLCWRKLRRNSMRKKLDTLDKNNDID